MASQLLGIKTRFTNDVGQPLIGGQVYTYFAGTSTNQDSYSDAALTVPNTNPVILDDTGSADIFLKGSYRIRVFDKSGRFIEEQDNVTQAASQGDATELSNKVVAVEQSVIDTNIELAAQKLDTGITATAKFGGVARSQADVNSDTLDLRGFVILTDSDHTLGLRAAIDAAKLSKNKLVGAGTYSIKSGDVDFRHIECDLFNCTFIVDAPYRMIVGGRSNTAINPPQKYGVIQRPSITYTLSEVGDPCAVCIGAKNQQISVRFVQHIQFYMTTDPTTFPREASQAYSIFNINFAVKISIATDPRYATGVREGAGGTDQWFNENTLNLKRCVGFFMNGSYNHNHNIINGGTFEQESRIELNVGSQNQFQQIRFEGSPPEIYLGEQTLGNVITKTWFGAPANFWLNPIVTDLGRLNDVQTHMSREAFIKPILTMSITDSVINNTALRRAPSRKSLKSTDNFASIIGESRVFPIRKNDYIFTNIVSDVFAQYYVRVLFYDANLERITPSLADVETSFFEVDATNSCFTALADNNSNRRLGLRNSAIKYAQIVVTVTSNKSRQVAREIQVFLASWRIMTDRTLNDVGFNARNRTAEIPPTGFVGEVGDTFSSKTGAMYVCTKYIDSNLTAASNTNIIKVSRISGLAVDDNIGVEMDDGNVYWTTIKTIVDKDVTLNAFLSANASLGAKVYVFKLITK